MNKFLIGVVLLAIGLLYLNSKTDGMVMTICNNLPKFIALSVAILAIFFPRDYHRVPDMLHKYNKKNLRTSQKRKRNVTESVKKFVASTQQWKCKKCAQMLDASYEVDHIIPIYKGGSNEAINLQALCRNCHGMKTMMDRFN